MGPGRLAQLGTSRAVIRGAPGTRLRPWVKRRHVPSPTFRCSRSTPPKTWQASTLPRSSGSPASTRTRAVSTRTCTRAGRGRCVSTPVSAPRRRSNERYRQLVAAGTGGLSVAFDLPTQMGYDSDAPLASGEVGKVGVAIDSIDDMKVLFDGLPLDKVSTSMTINAPASTLLLLYQLVAAEQGVSADKLTGTIQNDVLKEYIARGTYIYPPAQSLRLIRDIFAYCSQGDPALEHDLHLRLPHGRGRRDARAGDRVHPGQRQGVRPRRAGRRPRRRHLRARGCPSSSWPARRCWRRSRSSERPAGSGRGS